MARANHSRRLDRTEEAITVLFCLIDDAYALLNPRPRFIKQLTSEPLAPLGRKCHHECRVLSSDIVIQTSKLILSAPNKTARRSFMLKPSLNHP